MTKRLDPEVKVLRAISRALAATKTLDSHAQRRVLGWMSEKAYAELRKVGSGER